MTALGPKQCSWPFHNCSLFSCNTRANKIKRVKQLSMVALMTMTDNKNVINPIFGISASIKERQFYFLSLMLYEGNRKKNKSHIEASLLYL